jgi:hypothetical protein
MMIDTFLKMFQNLNKVQVETFVINLFNNCEDWKPFKELLRDLLVSMKNISCSDDAFYMEEK